MHIMYGFLPIQWVIIWYIISGIVVLFGIYQLTKLLKENPEYKPLLALSGAFMFILSSLKMPSVTGSCSHPCGNALGAILFGVPILSVLSAITLTFQALLLNHGGLDTMGANIFSMGIMGPLAGLLTFKALKGTKLNSTINVGISAIIADWMTYVTTSVELALAYPTPSFQESLMVFLGIFALTQIPLAVAEGILTAVIWDYIKKLRPDILLKLGVIDESEVENKALIEGIGDN